MSSAKPLPPKLPVPATVPDISRTPPAATPRPTATTLQTSALLAELPAEELTNLAAVADWETYKPGDVIIRQNDKTNVVFFVLSGYIKAMRGGSHSEILQDPTRPERRERSRLPVMVSLFGPGDQAGEAKPLLGIDRITSLLALTPCEVIRVPGDAFLSVLQRHPAFALAVMRRMARHQVEANRQIELMRGDLEGRIHSLLRNCRAMGLDTERWLTNAEIARLVGATRVAVSQVMGRSGGLRDGSAPANRSPRTSQT